MREGRPHHRRRSARFRVGWPGCTVVRASVAHPGARMGLDHYSEGAMKDTGKRRKGGAVSVTGPWIALPLQFLGSRACASLSPVALKMLLDLCGQLGPNANGNGDLSAAPSVMRSKGWRSNATRQAALDELVAAKLLCMTRQGGRRQCSLYAITLWPMACDFRKLDFGPGVYSTNDWRGHNDEAASRPTDERPAAWTTPRKNDLPCPATGEPPPVMTPPRGKQAQGPPTYDPATGSIQPISASRVTPPRATYLDKPSVAAIQAATH